MTDSRYASRKFVLSCAALFLAWSSFPFDLVTSSQVLDFTKWVLGIYMAGNVGDTFAAKGQGNAHE